MTVRGEPRLVSMCHCQQCQRRTGSAFGVAAFFDEDQVVDRQGEPSEFRRQGESGGGLSFRFCPRCGSTVFWIAERRPGQVAIAAGAFADPGFPAPSRTVWTEFRHQWLEAGASLPAHPGNPQGPEPTPRRPSPTPES
jgi:hypothetical protein